MFSFNSNFWMQLGMNKENPFDKHFEKQDLTLQELLDDDVIIGEFRNQHQKLMDLQYVQLCSIQLPQVLELVKYITVMPSDQESSKRQFRYPFYACELLCCQIPKVDELFFGQDKQCVMQFRSAFNELLQFVQQNDEVNPVLGGYVSKVLGNLSRQKPLIFYQECYQNQNFIESLARQLQSRSIAEIIIKLICAEVEQQDFIQERISLLKLTLDKIGQSEDFEVPQNVCQIVQEMLSQAYIIANAQPLLDILIEYLPKLCVHATNENPYISLSAGEIIYQILTLVLKNKQRQESEETVFKLDVTIILKHLEEALPSWIKYLQTKEKLGQNKVKLVEILCFTVNLQQEGFLNVLAQQNIFSLFNELLAIHDKNNIFQLIYQRFLQVVFDHKYEQLIQNLFVQSSFTSFLISLTSEPNVDQKKGYFGFITKFAKYLEDSAHKDPKTFGQYIETEEWQQFRVQYFEKAQQISEQELGGLNKKNEKNQEENTSSDVEQLSNNIIQMSISGTEESAPQQLENVQPEAEQIRNIFESFNINVDQQQVASNWDNNTWSASNDNQFQSQPWESQQDHKPQFFGDFLQNEQQINHDQVLNNSEINTENKQSSEEVVQKTEETSKSEQIAEEPEPTKQPEEEGEKVVQENVQENQESKQETEQQQNDAAKDPQEQQQDTSHFWQIKSDSKQEEQAEEEFNQNS